MVKTASRPAFSRAPSRGLTGRPRRFLMRCGTLCCGVNVFIVRSHHCHCLANLLSLEYKVRRGSPLRVGRDIFQQLGDDGNLVAYAVFVSAAAAVGASLIALLHAQRNFVLRCHCFPNSLSIVSLHDKSVVTGVQSPASHAAASKRNGQVRSKPAFRTPEASRPVVFASSFSPR